MVASNINPDLAATLNRISALDLGAGISAEARAPDLSRIVDDAETARRNGFAIAPPVRAIGSPLVKVGHDNWQLSRRSFEALPSAADGLEVFRDRIRAEARHDIIAAPEDLHMLQGGSLSTPDGLVDLEPDGFLSLARNVTQDRPRRHIGTRAQP